MNLKIDANEAAELCSRIKKADASLENIMLVIKQQALPVAHELFKENIDQSQKLYKSLSALLATGENQHSRFVKLISILNGRAKMNKIIETFGKTKTKGDKLITELRVAESRLDDYILITKGKSGLAGIRASCKYCAATMVERITEFETDVEQINSFFVVKEKGGQCEIANR